MPQQITQDDGAQASEQLSSTADEGFDPREREEDQGSVMDWREHVRERPELWLGMAFVGGLLVAGAFKAWSGGPERSAVGHGSGGRSPVKAQALEFWNNMQGALVGVASARIREYIDGLVPGFHEHYSHAEQRAGSGASASR